MSTTEDELQAEGAYDPSANPRDLREWTPEALEHLENEIAQRQRHIDSFGRQQAMYNSAAWTKDFAPRLTEDATSLYRVLADPRTPLEHVNVIRGQIIQIERILGMPGDLAGIKQEALDEISGLRSAIREAKGAT